MNEIKKLFLTVQRNKAAELKEFCDRHPYRTPKGFQRWEVVAALGVASPSLAQADDAACKLHAAFWRIWDELTLPVYCLDGDLLQQFSISDIDRLPELLPPGFRPTEEMMLVLLPSGALRSPNSGEYVCLFFVAYHYPGGALPISTEHPIQISVSAIDSGGCVWVSGTGVDPGRFVKARNELGADPVDEAEHAFLNGLTAIAVQCLLAREFLPELIGNPPGPGDGSDRKPPSPQAKPGSLSPRWIGQGFKPERSSTPRGGSHSSPRPHWRRGHWRSQPIGTGRKERRVVWIKPTMVKAE